MADFKVLPTVNGVAVSLVTHTHPAYDAHLIDFANPHNVTIAQIGAADAAHTHSYQPLDAELTALA